MNYASLTNVNRQAVIRSSKEQDAPELLLSLGTWFTGLAVRPLRGKAIPDRGQSMLRERGLPRQYSKPCCLCLYMYILQR
jgi:hypothetical protein